MARQRRPNHAKPQNLPVSSAEPNVCPAYQALTCPLSRRRARQGAAPTRRPPQGSRLPRSRYRSSTRRRSRDRRRRRRGPAGGTILGF